LRRPGLWYVFVGAKSLQVNYRDNPFRSLVVEEKAKADGAPAGSRG